MVTYEQLDFSLLIPAVLIGLVGAAVLGFIFRTIYLSLFGNPRGMLERLKLRRKAKLLEQFDGLISQSRPEQAYQTLHQCFFLDVIRKDQEILKHVHAHNMSAFEKILRAIEGQRGHIKNIAIVEELLEFRNEANEDLFKVYNQHARLSQKQAQREKELPKWTAVEFSVKLKDIEDQLATNRHTLETQLRDLFAELKELGLVENVVYH